MPAMTLMQSGRTATLIDPVTRVRQEATFVPVGPNDMFCMIHRPASAARRAVVICPSILAEQSVLCGAEVRAARILAAQGYAVMRFHYRGTGHSGGRPEAVTVASMADDARFAAETLVRETGIASLVFAGARWGAVAAGLAAADYPPAPLALWEPVVDGARYLPEILRAQAVRALTEQVDLAKTPAHVEREVTETGFADVLAYPVHRALYESMPGRHLDGVAAGSPRSVLYVHIHVRNVWRTAAGALRDAFAAAGSRVAPVLIPGEDPDTWSLYVSVRSTGPLIDATLRWLNHLEDAALRDPSCRSPL
jgi:alpha-beta hydrolase superfamily lysophospholipase